MLGILFIFGIFFVFGLAFSKQLRDYIVNGIGSVVSSVAIDTTVYSFDNFVNYLLTNTIGLFWLFSFLLILGVLAVNNLIYGKSIR